MLILKPDKQAFNTQIIKTHGRNVDSKYKYKLFEFATKIAKNGKSHELLMLSQMQSCDSYLDVYKQFRKIFPNVKISIISTKESIMKRKYTNSKK